MSKKSISKTAASQQTASSRYHIVRVFIGSRTAEEVVADLVKVHSAA